MSWTQPLCEQCWVNENIKLENDQISIRSPVRVVGEEDVIEVCCMCGHYTLVGIYIRRDPVLVRFPKESSDD